MAALSEHTVAYGDKTAQKSIFYYACGPAAGPLLIFVHGWPTIAKTWINQLTTFSSLGFRCVAPDMPGSGRSTATKDLADYTQEAIVGGLLAVLADTGRDAAVWIGHDAGSVAVWSLVAHYPSKCLGVASLNVPYRVVELGIEECVRHVNRDIYPVDKYPDGQWSYMRFYQQSFDKAVNFHDANVAGFTKLLFVKAPILEPKTPAFTATTVRDGGWLGGVDRAPAPETLPDGPCVLPPDLLAELTASLQKNGYFGPNAFYAHSEANHAYNTAPDVDPVLRMPVLFLDGQHDKVLDVENSRLAEPQRRLCRRLTEDSIQAGHWMQVEAPAMTNASIARWLATEVPAVWPGGWRTVTRNQ